jgi:hypothetical protein
MGFSVFFLKNRNISDQWIPAHPETQGKKRGKPINICPRKNKILVPIVVESIDFHPRAGDKSIENPCN